MSAEIQPIHRFSVVDYYKMLDVGILAEGGRYELLLGQVVEVTPEGPQHSSVIDRLADVLRDQARSRYIVRVQHPLHIDNDSEPEPDIAVVGWRDDYYANAHPTARDAWLVIEVAGRSLATDRTTKLALYATAGIVEFWIVNLSGRIVEAHRKPIGNTYQEQFVPANETALVAYPDVRLPVARLFG